MMLQNDENSIKLRNILNEMTSTLSRISNRQPYTGTDAHKKHYESFIKVKNANLLPPIIDDKLKSEIDFYKRKAKEKEEKMAKKKHDIGQMHTKRVDIKDQIVEGQSENSFVRDLLNNSSINEPTYFDTGNTDLNQFACGDIFNIDTNLNGSIYEEDESIVIDDVGEQVASPSPTTLSPHAIPLERKSSFIVDKPSPLLKNFEPQQDDALKYLEYLESVKAKTIEKQREQMNALKQQYIKQCAQLEREILDNKDQVEIDDRNSKSKILHKDYPSILFNRLGALIKGYLVRRLLRTERVQILVKTIRNESPIKKGRATSTDIDLIDRIIGQLQSALQDVNQIFFMIPTKERMMIIEQDRKLKQIIKMKLEKDDIDLVPSTSSVEQQVKLRSNSVNGTTASTKHKYLTKQGGHRASAIPVMAAIKLSNSESTSTNQTSDSSNHGSANNLTRQIRQVKKLNTSSTLISTTLRSQSCKSPARLSTSTDSDKTNSSNFKRQGTFTIKSATPSTISVPNIIQQNIQQPKQTKMAMQRKTSLAKDPVVTTTSSTTKQYPIGDMSSMTTNIPTFTHNTKQPIQMEVLERNKQTTPREIVKPKQIDMSVRPRMPKK